MMTINEIQDEMRTAGSHWWDPDTMRTFGTKVVGDVYSGPDGVFFATSDKCYDGSRAYSVRQYRSDEANISTVGNVGSYSSKIKAERAAKEMAGENAAATSETLRPISDAEQLLHDLHAHGCPLATSAHVRSLMAGARKHHRGCEHQCNGDEQGDRMTRQAELAIATTCRKIGCGVRFQGDPRGCTVKLVLPDGFCDDMANDGLCVPR